VRDALSPYMKQIRFVFKGLMHNKNQIEMLTKYLYAIQTGVHL
jgi:hypothetical protein